MWLTGWLTYTVIVPAHADVEIAVHFERHAGLFMYHCHMLEHEENGMMGLLLVGAVAAASAPISLPTTDKER
jgi:FtsP/CotA-like multicopper oxidase with cupredoxin domain